MLDRRIAILSRHRAKDESRETIAAAQVFVVSLSVNGLRLRQNLLLVGAQLKTQSINDVLGDLVLHGDDVFGRSIDTIAPNDFPALRVQQLRVNAKAAADGEKAGG